MKLTLASLFSVASAMLIGAPNFWSQAHDPLSPAHGHQAPGQVVADSQESGVQSVTGKQKITTFLWFDNNAEEAIHHYTSIFANSKILSETRWGEGGPVPKGTLMSAVFELAGQEFMALNGGPQFRFTEAISLLVNCETQNEVDGLWQKLVAGGEPSQCGWLKDKYGLSWQLIPTVLGKMLQDEDPAKVKRVTEAMLQMGKLDIKRLQQAYDGR